jgi:glycolate oxidase iron-sulfur subunit
VNWKPFAAGSLKEKRARPNVAGAAFLEGRRDELERCVKCGACRAECPVYIREEGETSTARGRLALIKAALDGRLKISRIYRDRLTACVDCLACEVSCPAGVPVTELIQAAKEQAAAECGRGFFNSLIVEAIKHPAVLRVFARLVPPALHYSAERMPGGAKSGFPIREEPETGSKGTVAFFPGCAVRYLQPDIGRATEAVLAGLGYRMFVPEGLGCCGKPALSVGDRAAAEELAMRNARVLSEVRADAVVTACASCGLMLKKKYPGLLPAGMSSPKVQDIHEFISGALAEAALAPVGKTVTVHYPCHLGRGQGLSKALRDSLRTVPGLTVVEMQDADVCCGFGGVLRAAHYALSNSIAERKVRNIIATKADAVVTGCPGCRMQLADALRRAGSDIEVLHTVQVLERAMSGR